MSRILFEDSVFDPGVEQTTGEQKPIVQNGEIVEDIAPSETKYVTISKVVCLCCIIAAAGLVTTGTYVFLKQEEDHDYTRSYEDFIRTARETVEFRVNSTVLAALSLSQTLTAEAKALRLEFPFVTYPSFETLCSGVRAQGGFDAIFFQPIVNGTNLKLWNEYSVENLGWIETSREAASSLGTGNLSPTDDFDTTIADGVYFGIPSRGIRTELAPSYGQGPYIPVWMQSPPPSVPTVINFDTYVPNKITTDAVFAAREALMSEIKGEGFLGGHESMAFDQPHTTLHVPVFQKLNDENSRIVGVIGMVLIWDHYVQNLLPEGITGITCVLKNTCGQAYTYKLDGNKARLVGDHDLHDERYEDTEMTLPLYNYLEPDEARALGGHCIYSYHIYSSSDFEDRHRSGTAIALTLAVGCTFILLIGAFFFYDAYVKRRNSKVLDIAAKTSAIVSSLFPSNVRDRLLQGNGNDMNKKEADGGTAGNRLLLKNFLRSEHELESPGCDADDLDPYGSKPIADIFTETTVLFADIVGFTAWSSTREPTQVFTLLETIYKAFDDIATRRRVFKVETVGDCYVAVCGLPDPRHDHAVVMSRFARACLRKMQELVHKLELSLGPDTADLSMRLGLHSGPVTAGVLRGERARFQLFGDTMNTASRMESTGEEAMIQVSQETADLLMAAGKGSWIRPREDKVIAKGKGQLQTYWLATEFDQLLSKSSYHDDPPASVAVTPTDRVHLDKSERLVKWNCDLMFKSLQDIACARTSEINPARTNEDGQSHTSEIGLGTVLDEVQEIIRLPDFTMNKTPRTNVQLGPKVAQQLHSYVGAVAVLYRDNPFHCFEHASHVTMSVSKLMSRIIAPELSSEEVTNGSIESTLHDHTYGITSDPLVQFACVFSALIHDVDHTGVPNTQLARENPELADVYCGRSIAEQNSVDLAWNLLMEPEYQELRSAIYRTATEEARFRQLVVNSVMATDLMDKDLKTLRNHRWERAFSESRSEVEESAKDAVDRKATIVIEHLIQASDVAHTMQHWHVYRKWNQRLYAEMHSAYMMGRGDRDPAEFWYQGELGFFDFYIIPLARKLKECGVFGVSSDEYLNYALKNRAEWEERGKEVVAEMVHEMSIKSAEQASPSQTPQPSEEPLFRGEVENSVKGTPEVAAIK